MLLDEESSEAKTNEVEEKRCGSDGVSVWGRICSLEDILKFLTPPISTSV